MIEDKILCINCNKRKALFCEVCSLEFQEQGKQETLKQVRKIIDKCLKYIPLVSSEIDKNGIKEIEAVMSNDENGSCIFIEELKAKLEKLDRDKQKQKEKENEQN